MANQAEIGVHVNRAASRKAHRNAERVMKLAGAYRVDMSVPLDELNPKKRIYYGGDGTASAGVSRGLVDAIKNRVTLIGIAGGGTNNVLYEALREGDLVMSTKEFLDAKEEDYPDRLFKPVIFGNPHYYPRVVVTSQGGWGKFLAEVGLYNERLRLLHMPSLVRKLGSKMIAAGASLVTEHPFKMIAIARNIGAVEAFPDQKLLDGSVTRATIDGNTQGEITKKFISTMVHWAFGRQAPEHALTITKARGFVENVSNERYLWANGDTRRNPFPQRSDIYIRRSHHGVPVVAIVD